MDILFLSLKDILDIYLHICSPNIRFIHLYACETIVTKKEHLSSFAVPDTVMLLFFPKILNIYAQLFNICLYLSSSSSSDNLYAASAYI